MKPASCGIEDGSTEPLCDSARLWKMRDGCEMSYSVTVHKYLDEGRCKLARAVRMQLCGVSAKLVGSGMPNERNDVLILG